MITNRKLLGHMFCMAALGSGLCAQVRENTPAEFNKASVAKLRQVPTAYKNVWVTFTGHFTGIGKVHNPFFTRFTRADYVNFAIWGDGQKIWVKDEYEKPFATLFCNKTSEDALRTVYSMPRYQRVRCWGIVRNVFQGEPWVEVTEVEALGEKITIPTLAHMNRATRLMKGRRWAQAARELEMAKVGGIVEPVTGWIHTYTGVCFMRVGRTQDAWHQLRLAKLYLPDEGTVDEYIDVLANNPRAGVDQKTEGLTIRKGRRPMWEAYKQSQSGNTQAPTPDPMPDLPPTLTPGPTPDSTGPGTTSPETTEVETPTSEPRAIEDPSETEVPATPERAPETGAKPGATPGTSGVSGSSGT